MAEKKKTKTTPTRTCAWTEEESSGRMYVLQSTEGAELVSEGALRGAFVPGLSEKVDELTRKIRGLEAKVRKLESARADADGKSNGS